jgi:DNA-binding winged helix-turn-helix (wHTH) protein
MRLSFGECVLDLDRRELLKAGRSAHLTTRAFDLLVLLARARPRALAKDEIVAALWPDTFVSEGSLAVLVAEVRRALGDDARAPRYLRTVHGYGYAFCAEAQDSHPSEVPGALCRLVAWGVREFRLGPGKVLIGRDPACEVAIDLASLSRRHARLDIEPGTAVIEDLGSKNGCTVNGAPVEAPRVLADGDEIRLGGAVLSFHWLPGPQQPDTLTAPTRSG